MNDTIRNTIKKLIREYGNELLDDPNRFAALLMDSCPEREHRPAINLVRVSLQENIPQKLSSVNPYLPTTLIISRLEKELQENHLLQQTAAQWIVSLWIDVLAISNYTPPSVPKSIPKEIHKEIPIVNRETEKVQKPLPKPRPKESVPVKKSKLFPVLIMVLSIFFCVLASNQIINKIFPRTEPLKQTQTPTKTATSQGIAEDTSGEQTDVNEVNPTGQSDVVREPITPSNLSQLTRSHEFGRGGIIDIAWSPDDEYIAVASTSGVCIYDSSSLSLVKFISVSAEYINQVVWFKDSTQLAVAVDDGIFFLDRFTLEGTLFINTNTPIHSIDFSPDGQTLISGGADGTIRLWEVSNGMLLNTFSVQTGAVNAVSFHPDGEIVASIGDDGIPRLWDVTDGSLVASVSKYSPSNSRTNSKEAVGLMFSPGGDVIAVWQESDPVMLWDIEKQEQITTIDKISNFRGGIGGIAFNSDGSILYTTTAFGLNRYELNSGTFLDQWSSGSGYVGISSVEVSPDGQHLIAAGINGSLYLWDIASGKIIKSLESAAIWSIAISKDGLLATGGEDSIVWVWNSNELGNQSPLALFGHDDFINDVTFSSNGTLASASEDGTVRIWNLADKIEVHKLVSRSGKILSLAYNPDGTVLALGSDANTIELRNVETGGLIQTLIGYGGEIRSLAFSPNGQLLASGDTNRTVIIWDVNQGQLISALEHSGSVNEIIFDPTGNRIISSSGRNAYVWDLTTYQLQAQVGENIGLVAAMALSPDGQILALGGSNDFIELWRFSDFVLVHTLESHTEDVTSVAFNYDGSLLISGSEDGTVQVWEVKNSR